jgi:hypothetical protein
MRAAETYAIADEMKEAEPKAIMHRIAADYERLAEWAEKNSVPWWDKKRVDAANSDELPELLRKS